MLVVSRKVDQTVIAQTPFGDVTFVINKIRGSSVTVGIIAPQDIKILRGEINEESYHKHARRDDQPTNADPLHGND